MNVLVAWERKGTIRNAFREAGHKAFSADPLGQDDKYHLPTSPVELAEHGKWDLVIAVPHTHYISNNMAKWWGSVESLEGQRVLDGIRRIWNAKILRKAVLAPPSYVISNSLGPHAQRTCGKAFGGSDAAIICLWLKGLDVLDGGGSYRMPKLGGEEREVVVDRALARAIASQWG